MAAIGFLVRSAISTTSGAAVSSGRSAMRRAERLRHAGLDQLRPTRRARRGGILRQRLVERRGERRDALAIVLDHAGQALRQIGVAQEPDQPVEQQILHGGVKLELHLRPATLPSSALISSLSAGMS